MTTLSSIEFVDRRRQNKDEEVTPSGPAKVVTMAPKVKGPSGWKDVCYVLALMPQQDGSVVVLGRACGKRTDGFACIADYLLPQLWAEDYRWQPKAKDRLDTFLDCECAPRAMCAIHKMYVKQWQQQDVQRMTLAMQSPPPEALEAVILAERAAQAAQVVVPR